MSNLNEMNHINEALSNAFFDVVEEEVRTESGLVIPGKKVICRKDDNTPLAIVGDKYKTVTNEEVFSSFTNILARSDINLEGAEVSTEFSHGGARTFAQIIFPSHEIKVGDKDATALRVIARNSYDGSTAFIVQAGGYRFVCSNGQIMGDNISYFHGKHTPSLDVKMAAEHISNVLDSFENSKEWFESLRTKTVNDPQAYACLAFASRSTEAARVGYVDREEMPRSMRMLFDSWLTHKKTMGNNAWSLYNCMTAFSSHWGDDKDEQHANAASSKFRREDRIRETLSSAPWLKIAA